MDKMTAYIDHVLAPNTGHASAPNERCVIVVGARADTSAEIERRAREAENDPLSRIVPFESEAGELTFVPHQLEELAALGITPEEFELAMLEEAMERQR
jgi:hypothetical protein